MALMISLSIYQRRSKDLFSDDEHALLRTLSTPQKIQDYLDAIPMNFADTHRSPRYAIRKNKAQCIEGALIAAAALLYHGRPPLLVDLRTAQGDDDHVIAVFKERGHFGAISKTNHAVLRWRDPIFKSMRELALSYAHEYFLDDGKKTLRSYTAPFDMRQYEPEDWLVARENLWWLAKDLDRAEHTSILPPGMSTRALRYATAFECQAFDASEWQPQKTKAKKKYSEREAKKGRNFTTRLPCLD